MTSHPSLPEIFAPAPALSAVAPVASDYDPVERPARVGLRHFLRLAPVVSAGATLSEAVARMVVTDAPAVVVVDDGRRPLGVLTANTVLAAVARAEPEELGGIDALDASRPSGAMLLERAELSAAARLLAATGSDHALVVFDSGQFAGLITAVDVLSGLEGNGASR